MKAYDYDAMRRLIWEHECGYMNHKELYNLLWDGNIGWSQREDEEVLEAWLECFGKGYIPLIEEDPADRDDRLYHEEQDHIAMEKAKENK